MLEIDQIDVFYGDLQALWNVSLTVQEGEIAALVGSNGAGKSTLLKTICGLLKLTRGSIRFSGLQIDKTPAHLIVQLGICLVHEGRRWVGRVIKFNNPVSECPKIRCLIGQIDNFLFGQPEDQA